jgi:hypothetical protein
VKRYYIEEYRKFKLITYYTIRAVDQSISETDKFSNSYVDNKDYKKELLIIRERLAVLGELKGAGDLSNFRDEKLAKALPSKKIGCNLRLYCYPINPREVLLGGGGIKETLYAQDGKDTNPPFQLMNQVVFSLQNNHKNKRLSELVGTIIEIDDELIFR